MQKVSSARLLASTTFRSLFRLSFRSRHECLSEECLLGHLKALPGQACSSLSAAIAHVNARTPCFSRGTLFVFLTLEPPAAVLLTSGAGA